MLLSWRSRSSGDRLDGVPGGNTSFTILYTFAGSVNPVPYHGWRLLNTWTLPKNKKKTYFLNNREWWGSRNDSCPDSPVPLPWTPVCDLYFFTCSPPAPRTPVTVGRVVYSSRVMGRFSLWVGLLLLRPYRGRSRGETVLWLRVQVCDETSSSSSYTSSSSSVSLTSLWATDPFLFTCFSYVHWLQIVLEPLDR